MKAILICPDHPPALAALAESVPLPAVPLLGFSLLEYWLGHLVTLGAKDVQVLAADRPDQVREALGDGARWGLRLQVVPAPRELAPEEARDRYRAGDPAPWLPAPNDCALLDHLPCLPHQPLLTSYAAWFAAAVALMPHSVTPDRLGIHEVQPGVWLGLHAQVARDARLIPPCWLGAETRVEGRAVIGPDAILENGVFVSRGAEVAQSLVGPETFVGRYTELRNSIAWGSTLVNWQRDSCLRVPDAFLLCSLAPPRPVPRRARTAAPNRAPRTVRQFLTRALTEFVPPRGS